MLVSSQLAQVPSVERLVDLWAERYLPRLSKLGLADDPGVRDALRSASASSGRAQTAEKLPKKLVEERCRLAAVRVKDTYDHLPEGCDCKEVLNLARFAAPVYLKLLDVYQESAGGTASKAELRASFGSSSLAAWGMPNVDTLSSALEPLLLAFQEQHMIAKDWRTLGFITTEINFSSALLLEYLSPAEQVLIGSYFDFLEEQVALPWQRMCAAAARYDIGDPVFRVVEQMLPQASDIALTVYTRACRTFSNYHGRRGSLKDPKVKHSSLRDLSMFQAYLWLAVLQGSLQVVEQELIALCVVVLEEIGVPWKMTAQGIEMLTDEIISRLGADQVELVKPYTDGMVRAFNNSVSR
ncbi:MAG: hypothetical protein WBG38_15005 [Nodosilinea sp.]